MTFDLQDTHQEYTDHGNSYEGESEPVTGLRLDLLIEDAESIAALAAYSEGRERTRFVRTALRIGILALNQAKGRIDSESVRNEGDRMVRRVETMQKQISDEFSLDAGNSALARMRPELT